MRRIDVRFSDEVVSQVRSIAKAQGFGREADAWRLVVQRGLLAEEMRLEAIDSIAKMTVELLCITRRILGAADEKKLNLAQQEAATLIAKLVTQGVIRERN